MRALGAILAAPYLAALPDAKAARRPPAAGAKPGVELFARDPLDVAFGLLRQLPLSSLRSAGLTEEQATRFKNSTCFDRFAKEAVCRKLFPPCHYSDCRVLDGDACLQGYLDLDSVSGCLGLIEELDATVFSEVSSMYKMVESDVEGYLGGLRGAAHVCSSDPCENMNFDGGPPPI